MKSAEEWADEWTGRNHSNVVMVKKIQLDAMKEGARRAANVCCNNSDKGIVNSKLNGDAILTTAEQWTEKDL